MKKVKIYENERLDIPDVVGLQGLVFSYVSRFFGAVLGKCEGLTDTLKLDYSSWNGNKTLTISGKAYLLKTFDTELTYENTNPEGFLNATGLDYPKSENAYCVWFDADYSPKTIDVSALATMFTADNASILGQSIWARRIRIDSDNATRRFWDSGTGGEKAQNVDTRTMSSLEWAVDSRDSAAKVNSNWIRVFDCIGWNSPSSDTWAQTSVNSYGINTIGSDNAPLFRPVMFWDMARQYQHTNKPFGGDKKTIQEGLGGITLASATSVGADISSPDSAINTFTTEPTGKQLTTAWRHPSQAALGSINETTAGNTDDKIGDGLLPQQALDILTAIEASGSHIGANATNPGLMGLLQNCINQLAEIKFGPTSHNRISITAKTSSGNFPSASIPPFTFSNVDSKLPVHDRGYKVTSSAGVTTEYAQGGVHDQADLNSVRPLVHLNQFYNNWGRSHPQILLSGMIAARVEATNYQDDAANRFSNFKWYGPLYNPLGFVLEQINGASSNASTSTAYKNFVSQVENSVETAYSIYPRRAPISSALHDGVYMRGGTSGITQVQNQEGVRSDYLDSGNVYAPRGGGFDILVKAPPGINDDEMHIFSVQCTETSAWRPGPTTNVDSPSNTKWPHNPACMYPNLFNLKAHVGRGYNNYSGNHLASENNLFISAQPAPKLREGQLYSSDSGDVHYAWFFITVFGVAPNHLTADRVFRGMETPPTGSTDASLLDQTWQVKWAKPHTGTDGSAYSNDSTTTLYGPDAAPLSNANQRLGWNIDTSYPTDGSGVPTQGVGNGFWSYPEPDGKTT